MLRITPSTSAKGAKEYFTQSLTRSDYYIDGQEVAGRWHGEAAQRLGLSGEVEAKEYFAMCDNRHPQTGEQLTRVIRTTDGWGLISLFGAKVSIRFV